MSGHSGRLTDFASQPNRIQWVYQPTNGSAGTWISGPGGQPVTVQLIDNSGNIVQSNYPVSLMIMYSTGGPNVVLSGGGPVNVGASPNYYYQFPSGLSPQLTISTAGSYTLVAVANQPGFAIQNQISWPSSIFVQ